MTRNVMTGKGTCARLACALAAALTFASVPLQAQSTPHYHPAGKIRIGGEGGWDYISCDAQAHRLYVSHSQRVVVVSTESGKVVGEIPNTDGVHGIAVADDLGKGFVSDGRSGEVTVVKLKGLETIGHIRAEVNPDAILYDPFTHRVFAFNGGSGTATVIDAKSDSVIGTIPLNGKPEFAVTDAHGRIFVNIEDKGEVAEIDPKTLTVTRRWSIAPGEEPSGLAIDAAHHRLFSVCRNKIMVISDADKGAVLTTLPIGGRVDGCAFDPGTMLAFASNGEGTMTVVHEESPSTFVVVDNVRTQAGARTITVDPTTHVVYLPTAEFGPGPKTERPRPRPAIVPGSFVVLEFRP